MKKLNYELFPTLVTKVEKFISEDQCTEIFNFLIGKKKELEHHDCLSGEGLSTYISGKRQNILKDISKEIKNCKNIVSNVENFIIDYAKETGYSSDKIFITDSWFNVQNKNSKLFKHAHFKSEISGGLYIKADENSSMLYFYNPNPFVFFTEINNTTKYACKPQGFKPSSGDLVIFPSWLFHGSNNSKNQTVDRTVISFNTSLK